MKFKIWLDLLKLCGLFAACWVVFSYFTTGMSIDGDLLDVSIENEEALGELMVDDMLLESGNVVLNDDSIVMAAMDEINSRLLSMVDSSEYDYRIRVIRDKDINAFAMPAGNIFVLDGLLRFAETPEEVAAVIAHEIGHAEHRHVTKRLIKELGLTLVFSVLTGQDPVLLQEITRTALSTVFDREQEREADQYSLRLLERAGINPVALASFFRSIDRKYGRMDDAFEILSTHPSNSSRIKGAMEYQTMTGFKAKPFEVDWNAVRASLEANSAD